MSAPIAAQTLQMQKTEKVIAWSERFGVSRSVVREAIAGLRSDGVAQSRRGAGTFVVSPKETATLRIDADLTSDRVVFRNVFEMPPSLKSRERPLRR
jgi:DNA-binding FadR family transcriptional regulator